MKVLVEKGQIEWATTDKRIVLFDNLHSPLTRIEIEQEIKNVLESLGAYKATSVAIETRFEGWLAVSVPVAIKTVLETIWEYDSKNITRCEIWTNNAFTYDEYYRCNNRIVIDNIDPTYSAEYIEYLYSKSVKMVERDFMEFWLWSCAEGFDIYKKDLKVAWEKYTNSDFGVMRKIKDRYYGEGANAKVAREVLNQYIVEQVGEHRKEKTKRAVGSAEPLSCVPI